MDILVYIYTRFEYMDKLPTGNDGRPTVIQRGGSRGGPRRTLRLATWEPPKLHCQLIYTYTYTNIPIHLCIGI